MKKSKDYTLIALLIPFVIALAVSGAFNCKSAEKVPVEEVCPYEVGECPNPACSNYIPTHDYEMELSEDSIELWDGYRRVGKVKIDWERQSPLDSLLLKDNE